MFYAVKRTDEKYVIKESKSANKLFQEGALIVTKYKCDAEFYAKHQESIEEELNSYGKEEEELFIGMW